MPGPETVCCPAVDGATASAWDPRADAEVEARLGGSIDGARAGELSGLAASTVAHRRLGHGWSGWAAVRAAPGKKEKGEGEKGRELTTVTNDDSGEASLDACEDGGAGQRCRAGWEGRFG